MKTSSPAPLSKRLQQTYDAIFQHPIARHLHRRDVIAMLSVLSVVTEEHNGNVKAIRNGHTLVLHATRDRNVAAKDELMMIRHFLQRSDNPAAEVPQGAGNFLVVIDHREARVYNAELHGTVPDRIAPFDPQGFGRNLHYVQDDSNGQRKPERRSFYDAIAKTLLVAREILIFGSGTGASSAMEQLLTMLRDNYPKVAECVVGSVALDAQHHSEDQLLALAREFYDARALSSSAHGGSGEHRLQNL
jgi:hypothetical protein